MSVSLIVEKIRWMRIPPGPRNLNCSIKYLSGGTVCKPDSTIHSARSFFFHFFELLFSVNLPSMIVFSFFPHPNNLVPRTFSLAFPQTREKVLGTRLPPHITFQMVRPLIHVKSQRLCPHVLLNRRSRPRFADIIL